MPFFGWRKNALKFYPRDMIKYVSKDNDMIDALCAKYYGTERLQEAVLLVLSHNRFLATYDYLLPAGLVIEFPDMPADDKKQGVALWD